MIKPGIDGNNTQGIFPGFYESGNVQLIGLHPKPSG
jgi:hypothetical protein